MSQDEQEAKQVIRIVKKGGGHDEHHGGSWKVAYADFVTAMMAFFLVMWIIGMDENVKEMIEAYFENPVAYQQAMANGGTPLPHPGGSPVTLPAPSPPRTRTVEQAELERFSKMLRQKLLGVPELRSIAEQVKIKITREGLRVELVETSAGETFFRLASSDLRPAARQVLGTLAPALDGLPNPVIVEGHTDARVLDREGYTNWELAADRANEARRILREAGLSEGKVVEVRSYADRQLVAPDDPLEARNRRISLLLPRTYEVVEGMPHTAISGE
jgi:chemotaxis protein MotB